MFFKKWSSRVIISLLHHSPPYVSGQKSLLHLMEPSGAFCRGVYSALQGSCFARENSTIGRHCSGINVALQGILRQKMLPFFFFFFLQRGLIRNKANFTWLMKCYSIVE